MGQGPIGGDDARAGGTETALYKETGVGLDVTATLQIVPALGGEGTLAFHTRQESGSGSTTQDYSDHGTIVRGSTFGGGPTLYSGTSSTTLIGAYHTSDSSRDTSDVELHGYRVSLSGTLSAASLTNVLQTGTVSVGGSGSLSFAQIDSTAHATQNSDWSEDGGRSLTERTSTQSDASPVGRTTTRVQSNASQSGSFRENSLETETSQVDSFGGGVTAWGLTEGGVGATGTVGTGGVSLGGGTSGSASWGTEASSSRAREKSSSRAERSDTGTVDREQTSDSGAPGVVGSPAPTPTESTKTVVDGSFTAEESLDESSVTQENRHWTKNNSTYSVGAGLSVSLGGVGVNWGTTTSAQKSAGDVESVQRSGYFGKYRDGGDYETTSRTSNGVALPEEATISRHDYDLTERLREDGRTDEDSSYSSTSNDITTSGQGERDERSDRTFRHEETGTVHLDGRLAAATATFEDMHNSTSDYHNWGGGNGSGYDNTWHSERHTTLHQSGTGNAASYGWDENAAWNGTSHSWGTFSGGSFDNRNWWTSSSISHAERGPNGAVGFTDNAWSSGYTSSSTSGGVTETMTGAEVGSEHIDDPNRIVPLFVGETFYVPQRMLSDGETWFWATVGVYSDYEVMRVNGMTFSQIPMIQERAEQLREEYGWEIYYTQYISGAASTLVLAAAATWLSGGLA